MKLNIDVGGMKLDIVKVDLTYLIETGLSDKDRDYVHKLQAKNDKGEFRDKRSNKLAQEMRSYHKIIPIELRSVDGKSFIVVDGFHRIAVVSALFDNEEIPAVVYGDYGKFKYNNEEFTMKSDLVHPGKYNFSSRVSNLLHK